MTDFEAQRLENLKQKQRLLADLNLHSHNIVNKSRDGVSEPKHSIKRRRLDLETRPSRSSARIALAGSRPSYSEGSGERYLYVERQSRPKGSTRPNKSKIKDEVEIDGLDESTTIATTSPRDVESIQAGWTAWAPTGAPPSRDADGVFYFSDSPTFTPNKSPSEVLREGAFGGSYFRPLRSRTLGITVTDDWREIPTDWISGLDPSRYLTNEDYDPEINKFGVSCGLSIEEWEAHGWIRAEYDVRGWFQWYCRFFQGRRCEDDQRQISRWAKCVGERGRWRRTLVKKYLQAGVREVWDDGEDEDVDEKRISPVVHQTCHHWAYELRQGDLDDAWRGGLR